MRWFPVAFLANGVLKVTHGGIELTTPVLRVRMLNHYAAAPLKTARRTRNTRKQTEITNENKLQKEEEKGLREKENHTTDGLVLPLTVYLSSISTFPCCILPADSYQKMQTCQS